MVLYIGRGTDVGLSIGQGGIRFPGNFPFPPKNVTATVDGLNIVLTWDAASSVDGYNAYQSIDGGTWTKLNATTVEALTHTLTPTDPGEYNFYVTSVRGTKESAASAETTTTEAMMEQVYTDTLSPRISAVDGTAFVDNTADITTYADGNHLLEVQDSDGNVISGVLKAQGIGETLGTNLVTGWTNVAGVDTLTVSGADITEMTKSTDDSVQSRVVSNFIGYDDNRLYKFGFMPTVASGTGPLFISFSSSVAGWSSPEGSQNYSSGVAFEHYETCSPLYTNKDYSGFRRYGDLFSASFTGIYSKAVTAPSTSGATLVDELSGTTQNLFTAPAEFIYREASYTVRVKKILPTA